MYTLCKVTVKVTAVLQLTDDEGRQRHRTVTRTLSDFSEGHVERDGGEPAFFGKLQMQQRRTSPGFRLELPVRRLGWQVDDIGQLHAEADGSKDDIVKAQVVSCEVIEVETQTRLDEGALDD